jgi:hypothetical protein
VTEPLDAEGPARRAESDALHERVRAFARRHPPGTAGDPAEFDALAVDIARYQARYIGGARRLLRESGRELDSAAAIPAVPVAAFRMARVAAHPPEEDATVFVTSGTTGARAGRHPMRTLRTYRELSVGYGRIALSSGVGGRGSDAGAWGTRRTVVALAPDPGEPPRSSLGAMMRAFAEEFGAAKDPGGYGGPPADGPFVIGDGGVDVEALRRAVLGARSRGESVLVLATGFALVMLLDTLGASELPLPPGSVVMPTGGFKARTREVPPRELAALVARAFLIAEDHVVFEYGMTELTSQLYEGTLPGGVLRAPPGVYLPPPWLRVTPVDPETLAPVPDGAEGIARFVDLGNVDSAVAIVNEDVIRVRDGGVELRGRRQGAEARGCSLAIEQMVLGIGSE